MTATYSNTSPYATTSTFGDILDVWTPRAISSSKIDQEYVIPPDMNFRPDKLAYKIYGTVDLWWVFAVRNPNTLKDPVFDFKTGVSIFIPPKATVMTNLGI